MGWVWWLLAPLAATSAAAVLTWIAGRPRRAPTSEEAVKSHRQFLADLADASEPAHRARSGDGPNGDRRWPDYTQPVSTQPVSAQAPSTQLIGTQSSSPQSGSGLGGGTGRPDKLPE